jgi:hypothetical protein
MASCGLPARPLIARKPLARLAEYSINAPVSGKAGAQSNNPVRVASRHDYLSSSGLLCLSWTTACAKWSGQPEAPKQCWQSLVDRYCQRRTIGT